MHVNFFFQWPGYPPKTFFKWGITCNSNHMFGWVEQLNSLGSSEKMLWYMAKRDWAAAANSSAQDSKLLRSNFPNSFSCHGSIVNLCIWWPWSSSDASVKLICTGISGIWVTMAALQLASSFSASWDMLCWSLAPQQWFYCHCTLPYRHSVPSGHGVRIHLQQIETESSHWSPLPGELSSSLHVWLGRRRHLWSQPPCW